MTLKSQFLVVEGMGDSVSASKGLAWTYGSPARHGTVADDYEWHGGFSTGAGMTATPSPGSAMADPFSATYSGGSMRLSLVWDAMAAKHWSTQPNVAYAYIGTELSKTGTTIDIDGTTNGTTAWSASQDGTVIWLNEEAILLGSYSAGEYTGCTRGYYNTQPTVHPVESMLFTRNPFRATRSVWLYELNVGTGVITQKWQGFIRPRDPYTVSGKVLTVEAVDLIAGTAEAHVNRSYSFRGSAQTASLRAPSLQVMTGKILIGAPNRPGAYVRVNKRNATKPHYMAFRVAKGGALWAQKEDNTRPRAVLKDDGTEAMRGGSLIGPLDKQEAYEMLVLDRARDTYLGVPGVYPAAASRYSSSRDLLYPFHPIANLMALLTSGTSEAVGEPSSGEAGEVPAEEDMTGKTILTDASDTITFETVAADTNTVLFLAGQQEFPGLKDYAGTYDDNDLCDVTALEASEQRGMYTGNARLTAGYPYAAALQLAAEGVWRVMFRTTSAFDGSSAINLFDFGGSGETEAVNFLSNFNITLAEEVSWLTEDGAGTNHEAKWLIPGQLQPSTEYLFEVRRTSANVVSVYMNGVQLKHLTGTTSVTDNADGTITDVTSGGGSGVLCYDGLGADSTLDVYFLHICDDVTGTDAAATYATGKRVLTTAESDWLQRDNFTSIAADGDIVVAFRPDASDTLTDVTGTITTWDTATGDTLQLLGSQYWTEGSSGYWEESIAATRLTGDLTLNVLAMASADNDTGAWVAQNGANGDGVAAENILYRLQMSSSTALQYFAESGTGTDITVTWTVDAWTAGEIREYRLVREDDGGGGHDVRAYERKLPATSWTQLTVATSTGTGVGTTEANVGQPAGGGSSVHRIGRGYATDTATPFWLREVSVYDAAKDPS